MRSRRTGGSRSSLRLGGPGHLSIAEGRGFLCPAVVKVHCYMQGKFGELP